MVMVNIDVYRYIIYVMEMVNIYMYRYIYVYKGTGEYIYI